MAQETTQNAVPETVLRWVEHSCAKSGVPLVVEDQDTLLDVAHKLSGA